MSQREQFNIVFTDDELYNNLILEYKQSKELKPLITKLLSAYYYDENIRNLVDEYSIVKENNEFSDTLKAINNNILLWNTMTISSAEEGVSKIKEYTSSSSQEFGTPLVKIEIKNPTLQNLEAKDVEKHIPNTINKTEIVKENIVKSGNDSDLDRETSATISTQHSSRNDTLENKVNENLEVISSRSTNIERETNDSSNSDTIIDTTTKVETSKPKSSGADALSLLKSFKKGF